MDYQIIDQFLQKIKEAMEWLQGLYDSVRKFGLPLSPFPPTTMALGQFAPPVWDEAAIRREHEKMLNRNRVRRWRKRKKEEKEKAKEKSVTCNGVMEAALPSVTDGQETAQARTTSLFAQDADAAATKENAAAVTANGNAPVMVGNDSVMAGNDFAKKEKENEKRKKQRKEINKNKKIKTNIADAMPNSARAHTREEEGAETEARGKGGLKNETGSCLPFVPGDAREQEMILTKDLQENYRNIVLAWNRLPVRTKLRGLFPSLVKRLHYIMKTYGEDKIYAAMDIIKKCPFLLGKSGNSRGWVIRFDWMLEPEHLEKILDGWYLDEPAGGRSQMFQPGDENVPFSDGFMGTVVY